MTTVDIIILAWDRIDDTIMAIDSALAQQNVDYSVIVVDQGSKPEALAQLESHCAKYDKITLIKNTQNNGVPGGRNQASFAGNGDYIVALDNDAEFVDSNQLSKMVTIMDKESQTGALAFRIVRYGAEGDLPDDRSSWSYPEKMEEYANKRFKTTRYVGAGHAIRRSVFEMVGGYDASLFFLHEEVDLSKRMIYAGFEIYYDPRIIVSHKVSAEHRVSWNGQRYFYDIRNKTYLHIKLHTAIPTMLFHTGLMVWRGIRSGYGGASLKGLGAAFIRLPQALKNQWRMPYTKSTPASRAYMDSCSPMAGMSTMQCIKQRLRDANKQVGT